MSRGTQRAPSTEDREALDSIEVSSELDDALNELGMLSSSSGTATASDLTGLTRKEFLKDRWRRGRYPLRREKEREISWSSSSSSGSCNSSGSSSRRSSSSSACSTCSGSFASLRASYAARSPLLSSFSVAETPTGCAPAPFSTQSSSSSFGSSGDVRSSDMLATTMRSVDVVKVLRHRVRRPSPYHRRCSLNIGFCKPDAQLQRPSSSSSGFFSSSGVGSDNLILRSGLSDSEASSGSGNGTPPPPHLPLSVRPNSFNPPFKHFSDLLSAKAAGTKSNPCSPDQGSYDMKLPLEDTQATRGKATPGRVADFSCQSQVTSTCAAVPPPPLLCPFASTAHVYSGPGPMSRSKSLDDLTSVALLSEDSSSSTDFAPGLATQAPTEGCFFMSTALAAHPLRQMQVAPPHQDSGGSGLLRCSHVPIHHHSHHQLLSQVNADPLLVRANQGLRPSSGHSSHVPACDSSLYDNVVNRMNQLEMN